MRSISAYHLDFLKYIEWNESKRYVGVQRRLSEEYDNSNKIEGRKISKLEKIGREEKQQV